MQIYMARHNNGSGVAQYG